MFTCSTCTCIMRSQRTHTDAVELFMINLCTYILSPNTPVLSQLCPMAQTRTSGAWGQSDVSYANCRPVEFVSLAALDTFDKRTASFWIRVPPTLIRNIRTTLIEVTAPRADTSGLPKYLPTTEYAYPYLPGSDDRYVTMQFTRDSTLACLCCWSASITMQVHTVDGMWRMERHASEDHPWGAQAAVPVGSPGGQDAKPPRRSALAQSC